jgi:hypothetical protein
MYHTVRIILQTALLMGFGYSLMVDGFPKQHFSWVLDTHSGSMITQIALIDGFEYS